MALTSPSAGATTGYSICDHASRRVSIGTLHAANAGLNIPGHEQALQADVPLTKRGCMALQHFTIYSFEHDAPLLI